MFYLKYMTDLKEIFNNFKTEIVQHINNKFSELEKKIKFIGSCKSLFNFEKSIKEVISIYNN